MTDEWEALLEGTTPGPWVVRTNAAGDIWLEGPAPEYGSLPPQPFEVCFYHNLKDVEVAATAPTAVAEVVRLRQAMTRLRDAYAADDDPGDDYGRGAEAAYQIVARDLTRILEGEA